MRTPKYLSPTSISKFYDDRQEFYLNYLADNRPPRMPQTQPMSVGSAFDAYVKSYIVEKLFGAGVKDQFDFQTIFEEQVEEHNRDWALGAGKYCFNAYKASGALADLMIELELAVEEPQFEITVQNNVSHHMFVGAVNFLGKPDIWYVNRLKHNVIVDWKVNGFCGRNATSPKRGYLMCRDGWDGELMKPSRNNGAPHKDAISEIVGGLAINTAFPFEQVDKGWAAQVSIYQWVLGATVGSDAIVGIDQLCAKPVGAKYPMIRVAEHRGIVSKEFQNELYKKAHHIWNLVTNVEEGQYPHVFDELSKEENDERCASLDGYADAFKGESSKDKWLQDITRQHKF